LLQGCEARFSKADEGNTPYEEKFGSEHSQEMLQATEKSLKLNEMQRGMRPASQQL